MNSILITGFVPWGNLKENSSQVIANHLNGIVLPVSEECVDDVYKYSPQLIIMFGLAMQRQSISLELNASNKFQKNKKELAVELGKEKILETKISEPILQKVQKKMDKVAPTVFSYQADTFICNYLYYKVLNHFTCPSLFIHLPSFENIAFEKQLQAAEIAKTILSIEQ